MRAKKYSMKGAVSKALNHALDRVQSVSKVGIFGLKPSLALPRGFQDEQRCAIDKIKDIKRTLLLEASKLPTSTVLHLLDTISNELCCVIDAAEACRNMHTDTDFLQASQVRALYIAYY